MSSVIFRYNLAINPKNSCSGLSNDVFGSRIGQVVWQIARREGGGGETGSGQNIGKQNIESQNIEHKKIVSKFSNSQNIEKAEY